MNQVKILILNYEKRLDTQSLFTHLNSQRLFVLAQDAAAADHLILIIGSAVSSTAVTAAQDIFASCTHTCPIVLVEKTVFREYEHNKDIQTAIHPMIKLFDSEQKRKWIYTYSSLDDIKKIIDIILLSDSFTFRFETGCLTSKPEMPFRNTLILQNLGNVYLEGYYIEGFYDHKMGNHRPKLADFQSELTAVPPKESLAINMDFTAPDIAGSFLFYAVLKKKGCVLKIEDTIASFLMHITSGTDQRNYDAVLLEETPPNGILFTKKMNFTKKWILKNCSGTDWPKIIFREKYGHFTHHFCKQRERVYTDIPNNGILVAEVDFYSPDIPGNYTSYWQLLREDGTGLSTDGPLCCSVVTQYEMKPMFELLEQEVLDIGILDHFKKIFARQK